ncbi:MULTISPECIES: dTDP-4-amino-4,6-dideoxygalactose transaminase [unclassified Pseudomonas]|uniref:dTDP-4-amino-4,6-dideoxygalactose transaminase n=1 Tax=unclassified Pseudomonas TaxID=196821 RepID=UPI001475AB0A|nr:MULTISPECIES: dTDP-4-amino-4,6-dideoxygalactose transaminase [unclassified Pseudomonas]NMY38595.1 dTDP-4-amino-4,6-dideoxygalactose transaminase [Pseudomonas sp. WS 5078]NMY61511.1 dTDP-4-amino-4,6-dideoxygalactose transaminase [Pseudomonas sp. WS 5354]
MIPFNKPLYIGVEDQFVMASMRSSKISGDGEYSKKCQEWFQVKLGCVKALLTPSCTHALEMAAILINIQPGDEVIMPSYTFVSTANAFVLRGAKIVFVDIRPDTMNINEELIEVAITNKTKAIVPVHYAGVACDMDVIMEVANKYGLYVIEDAAQAMMSTYNGKKLGSIGHFGAYSFHETKNYTSGGEGGLLIINDREFAERAEVIREKGTNRSQFFRGMVDKYSWVDLGSSYLPCDLQAAYLWGQLNMADDVNEARVQIWNKYKGLLQPLADEGYVELPFIPKECRQNAHMFYFKVKDLAERMCLIEYLVSNGVQAVFHYIPLHSSTAGNIFSRFHGQDISTTIESERVVRLPIWYGITPAEIEKIASVVTGFYK